MNLCYIGGCGRLGLSLASWSAEKGHSVICADINEDAVTLVNKGISPIDEPRVGTLVRKHRGKSLYATIDTPGAVSAADISLILVPTPSKPDGSFCLDYVLRACEQIGEGLKRRVGTVKEPYQVVIVVSTVMPGDTEGPILEQLEDSSGLRTGEGFGLAYSPEFIRQGSIVHDFANPDQVLIGQLDEYSGDVAEAYYKSVVDNAPSFRRMSLVSAEIAKIGLNSALVTKIDMANQLAWLCHYYPGADARDVLASIGADNRIGDKLTSPGGPVGGPCLPRDTRALVAASKTAGVAAPVAAAVADYRMTQIYAIVNLVPEDGIVGILGIAYKPGVSITEESQGLALVDALIGREIFAYDPMVDHKFLSVDSLIRLVKSSHTLVIMTPWPEFKQLEKMNLEGKLVIDVWGMLDEDNLNCDYIRLGEGK